MKGVVTSLGGWDGPRAVDRKDQGNGVCRGVSGRDGAYVYAVSLIDGSSRPRVDFPLGGRGGAEIEWGLGMHQHERDRCMIGQRNEKRPDCDRLLGLCVCSGTSRRGTGNMCEEGRRLEQNAAAMSVVIRGRDNRNGQRKSTSKQSAICSIVLFYYLCVGVGRKAPYVWPPDVGQQTLHFFNKSIFAGARNPPPSTTGTPAARSSRCVFWFIYMCMYTSLSIN